MRATWVALAAVAFAVGHAPRAQAQCIALVYFHGAPYTGYDGRRVEAGERLADKARQPACNDVIINGKPANDPDRFISVHAVKDVDRHVAIFAQDTVFVNTSTFPALPSHPLHDRLGIKWSKPARKGRRCTVSGRASFAGFGLHVDGKAVSVVPDTEVGPQRYGTGYVAKGTRVTVTGQPCTRSLIVARRITRG